MPNKVSILCRLLKKAWEVTFEVIDDETGAPLEGAAVEVTGSNGASITLPTGADGHAVFVGLKKGSFDYVVSHPDYENYPGTFVLPPTP